MAMIYLMIIVLFIAYILWTWNSTNKFSGAKARLIFLAVGTIGISIITLILFNISKSGVIYPKQEMIGEVRKIIMLVFVPINGLLILPQIANILEKMKSDNTTEDSIKRNLIILLATIAIVVVIECIYFKNIQTGIINLINLK